MYIFIICIPWSHLAHLAASCPQYPMLILTTVGFHNFNLRIFNLRVSNPNKLIVDVFF